MVLLILGLANSLLPPWKPLLWILLTGGIIELVLFGGLSVTANLHHHYGFALSACLAVAGLIIHFSLLASRAGAIAVAVLFVILLLLVLF
jgi:hypothetical protein